MCVGVEQCLDLVRREVWTLAEQQSRSARDDGGCLRRAAPEKEAIADSGGPAELVVDEGAGMAERDNVDAGSGEIRVARAVTLAREACRQVIADAGGVLGVGRAHGDDIGIDRRVVKAV